MRLIFVHGINNQGSSSHRIVREWAKIIEDSAGQPGLLRGVELVAPFYGDRLAAFTREAGQTVGQAVAQGTAGVADDDAEFVGAVVDEIAASLGIDPLDVQREVEDMAVPQGPGGMVTLPALQLIERWWPGGGDFALQFVKQANAYFKHPGAKKEIDGIVAAAIAQPGPQIVIGHSLGSVAAFDVLRQRSGDTHLYLTVGSPLPITAIQSKLGPPLAVPATVQRWLNAIDPSDFVGLGKGLAPPRFAAGIENLTDVRNGWNAHGIKGYLSDQRVIQAIVDALK